MPRRARVASSYLSDLVRPKTSDSPSVKHLQPRWTKDVPLVLRPTCLFSVDLFCSVRTGHCIYKPVHISTVMSSKFSVLEFSILIRGEYIPLVIITLLNSLKVNKVFVKLSHLQHTYLQSDRTMK